MQDQLVLNRYRLISEAGAGGFATVQLAWDTRIQRRVAIKCIQLGEEDVALGNLVGLEEARTAAMLNDSTIVGVYDFEIQDQLAYLIMEYVDGLTLTQLLDEYDGQLSLDVIASIFSSVAHALEIAHENQVLHLDIKPDNILINRQGQVKVTDFGLATLSDAVGFGAASGGTIGYMPLEQMRQESLDARCDEWALASITYEMLTGENPFRAPDLGAAEAAIENAEIVLPSLCKEGLPDEADDVLFYALDPDREERYNSVTDFAEEMEKFLGSPIKGQRELAVLVGKAREDSEVEEDVVERLSFFDRYGGRIENIIVRIWSFVNVGLLGLVALVNIPNIDSIDSPLLWGVLALLVLAAIFKPHLGAILVLFTLVVSLFANDALLVGLLLLVAAPLWWFFVGRKGDAQTNVALAPVFFGSFGFNQISPYLIGFFLNARETLMNTLMALFISIILAGFGSNTLLGWNIVTAMDAGSLDVQHNMALLLQQPETWIVMAAWLIAAILMRLFCLRQTRLVAFFGVVVATIVLLAGVCLGAWVSQGHWFPGWHALITLIAAGIVMSVLCTLGVPIRVQEWDEEEFEEDAE